MTTLITGKRLIITDDPNIEPITFQEKINNKITKSYDVISFDDYNFVSKSSKL
jgi:hypothetical protein